MYTRSGLEIWPGIAVAVCAIIGQHLSNAIWLSTPAILHRCVGDDVTFTWFYNFTEESNIIYLTSAGNGHTVMMYYVGTLQHREYGRYRGRTELVEHSENRTSIKVKNVNARDAGGYILTLGGPGEKNRVDLRVYSANDLIPTLMVNNKRLTGEINITDRSEDIILTVITKYSLLANISMNTLKKVAHRCSRSHTCASTIKAATREALTITVDHGICCPILVSPHFMWPKMIPSKVSDARGINLTYVTVGLGILSLVLIGMLIACAIARRERGKQPVVFGYGLPNIFNWMPFISGNNNPVCPKPVTGSPSGVPMIDSCEVIGNIDIITPDNKVRRYINNTEMTDSPSAGPSTSNTPRISNFNVSRSPGGKRLNADEMDPLLARPASEPKSLVPHKQKKSPEMGKPKKQSIYFNFKVTNSDDTPTDVHVSDTPAAVRQDTPPEPDRGYRTPKAPRIPRSIYVRNSKLSRPRKYFTGLSRFMPDSITTTPSSSVPTIDEDEVAYFPSFKSDSGRSQTLSIEEITDDDINGEYQNAIAKGGWSDSDSFAQRYGSDSDQMTGYGTESSTGAQGGKLSGSKAPQDNNQSVAQSPQLRPGCSVSESDHLDGGTVHPGVVSLPLNTEIQKESGSDDGLDSGDQDASKSASQQTLTPENANSTICQARPFASEDDGEESKYSLGEGMQETSSDCIIIQDGDYDIPHLEPIVISRSSQHILSETPEHAPVTGSLRPSGRLFDFEGNGQQHNGTSSKDLDVSAPSGGHDQYDAGDGHSGKKSKGRHGLFIEPLPSRHPSEDRHSHSSAGEAGASHSFTGWSNIPHFSGSSSFTNYYSTGGKRGSITNPTINLPSPLIKISKSFEWLNVDPANNESAIGDITKSFAKYTNAGPGDSSSYNISTEKSPPTTTIKRKFTREQPMRSGQRIVVEVDDFPFDETPSHSSVFGGSRSTDTDTDHQGT